MPKIKELNIGEKIHGNIILTAPFANYFKGILLKSLESEWRQSVAEYKGKTLIMENTGHAERRWLLGAKNPEVRCW